MKLIIVGVIYFLTYVICECESKLFTRCGFRDELIRLGFKRELIPSWICLVSSESGFDTKKIGMGPANSKTYGIFQINNLNYCKNGKPGGLCQMKCEDFLDDKIINDAACAVKIFERDGLKAWSGWLRVCTGYRPNKLAAIVEDCTPNVQRNTKILDRIQDAKRNITLYGNENIINDGDNNKRHDLKKLIHYHYG